MAILQGDSAELERLRHERSLVIIKPDAVARHLVGELISRFERKGLKMVGMKLVWPDEARASRHYTDSEEWLASSGQRTYDNFVTQGVTPPAEPRELALNTRRKLMESLTAGPAVFLVLEGAHVIEVVRKLRGATNPRAADVGTVVFDYTIDSFELSDAGDWAARNILHGSDSPENAVDEIAIWFKPEELLSYETVITKMVYDKRWQDHLKNPNI